MRLIIPILQISVNTHDILHLQGTNQGLCVLCKGCYIKGIYLILEVLIEDYSHI